ncbi:hypothetical protein BAMA_20515 [Bacillus manliponensis]|uniref:Beta-lactamase class A catalytic domain-containing protein n=1 Tax=Bacillus manliponensis TaxID=574376 RepID=A0A073JZL4_9BACI|nr:serine hydrolase [Bacillus manliponensis]KEK19647.1 hypothetical protein BAMA_20515 [Bacillus manliponensis]
MKINVTDVQQLVPSSVKLGFYLYDTNTKESLCINENETFPLASVAKWIASSIAFQAGIVVEPVVIEEAIYKHSTEAYLSILEKMSSQEINKELQQRGLELVIHKDNTSITNNYGTPASIFQLMHSLYESMDKSNLIFQALKQQEDFDGFRFSGPYEWLHMTGGLAGVCNDVGYLYIEDRVLLCIGLLQTNDTHIEWQTLERILQHIGALIVKKYTEERV